MSILDDPIILWELRILLALLIFVLLFIGVGGGTVVVNVNE